MIAVTLLSSYIYCARKIFIEKVLGIRAEIPKEAIARGSVRHLAYERINKSEEDIVKSISEIDFVHILGIFTSRYIKILKKAIADSSKKLRDAGVVPSSLFSEIKPMIENEAHFRASKIFNFAAEKCITGEELWLNITPKIKAEYMVASKELGLRGIIDELEVYESNFVPVELKTGKTPAEGVWPGHRLQAAAYAMMLESEFKTEVGYAVVRYLDTNSVRKIILNPFIKKEVLDTAAKVKKLLESLEIPDFADSEKKCNCCELREFCHDNSKVEEALKNKTAI